MYNSSPYEAMPYSGYSTQRPAYAGGSSGAPPQSSPSHTPHHHHHHAPPQQQPSGYAITEVFDPDFKFIYDVPTNCVVHLPPARLNITRLVLCRNYRPHEPQSCAMGSSCKFVHADCNYAKLEAHPIHVNYIWRNEGLCTYPRLPAGFMFTVWAPNKKPPTSLVPSERILVTRGSQAHMICLQSVQSGLASPSELDQAAPLSHCAHYYYNRMCNRGERCNFIHTVHVDPNVQGDFKRAPGRSQHHAQAASRADEAATPHAALHHHGRGRGVEPGDRSAPATATTAAAATSPPPLSSAAIAGEDSDGAIRPALNMPAADVTAPSSGGPSRGAAPLKAQRGARPVAAAAPPPPPLSRSTTPSPYSPCLPMPKHTPSPPPGLQVAPPASSRPEQRPTPHSSQRSGLVDAIERGSPTGRADESTRAGHVPAQASAGRHRAAVPQLHPSSQSPLDADIADTGMRPMQPPQDSSSALVNCGDAATMLLANTPSFGRYYPGISYADPSPMMSGSMSVPLPQYAEQYQPQQPQQPASMQPPHPPTSTSEAPLVWLARTESSGTTPLHGPQPPPSAARSGTGGYSTPSALSANRSESTVNVITRTRRRRDAPSTQLWTTTIPSSLSASVVGVPSSPLTGSGAAAAAWAGRYPAMPERGRDVNAPVTPLTQSPKSRPAASGLPTSGDSSGRRQTSRPRDSPPGIASLPTVLAVPTGIDVATGGDGAGGAAAGAGGAVAAGGRQTSGTTANNTTATTTASEGSLSGSALPLATPGTSASVAALQRASARGLSPQNLGCLAHRAGGAGRGGQPGMDVLTPTEPHGHVMPWPSSSSNTATGGAVSMPGFSGAAGTHFSVDSFSDEGAVASASVSATGAAAGADRLVHYHVAQPQRPQQVYRQHSLPYDTQPQQRLYGVPYNSSTCAGGGGGGGNAAQHPLPPVLLESSIMSAGGASDASNSNLEGSTTSRLGRFRHDPYATSGISRQPNSGSNANANLEQE